MPDASKRHPELILGADFGELTLRLNNVCIDVKSDGTVAIGGRVVTLASDGRAAVGAWMPDGTVYAGISPDTDKPMYTLPYDSAAVENWRGAQDHASAYGEREVAECSDWRLPTKAELKALFNNRAAIGGFTDLADQHGCNPIYWSSTEIKSRYGEAWVVDFTNGKSRAQHMSCRASVRLVRG